VHAATLARLLEIRRILVPPAPGVFSALGMLFPDIEHHYVRTHKRRLDGLDESALDATFDAMIGTGSQALTDEGFHRDVQRFDRWLDLRYVGANSELTLPFPSPGQRDRIAELRDAFRFCKLFHSVSCIGLERSSGGLTTTWRAQEGASV
jgi:N-methylhydantoinase A